MDGGMNQPVQGVFLPGETGWDWTRSSLVGLSLRRDARPPSEPTWVPTARSEFAWESSAQPGSWAGLHAQGEQFCFCLHDGRLALICCSSDPQKRGDILISRVGAGLCPILLGVMMSCPPGVTRQPEEGWVNAECIFGPRRNPHSASPRRKPPGKQQEALRTGCQVPPNQAPWSSCLWNHKLPEDRRTRL